MNKIVLISVSLILALVAGLAGCIAPPAKTVTQTQTVIQTQTVTQAKTVTATSTPTPTTTPGLAAAVTITDWEQGYYEVFEEWSYLDIYYVVENTGDIEIYMYNVYFTVKCKGGKEFYPQDANWGSVPVGKKISEICFVNVGNNQVISVEITDWELHTSLFD